jgi:hypothetical protein
MPPEIRFSPDLPPLVRALLEPPDVPARESELERQLRQRREADRALLVETVGERPEGPGVAVDWRERLRALGLDPNLHTGPPRAPAGETSIARIARLHVGRERALVEASAAAEPDVAAVWRARCSALGLAEAA